ncbi:hypothetical protein SLNWT_4358 [Streptomyces albus]|uniref:Uncharacterized protein n=1 Tax=Streptomyces albus (strain ATCC 21838 / DSM 41398 / FERM P-419 / JCM 4703 / NBRC 107858) TaxID=1081613 RepID=A0A0B5ESQ3_STRA4|nr:hypothetical protein SLNWT_4358 [Streptomyces albus]AOU79039.1 hypothetical protein SLNHY_4348 [Streptomyces albus]
MLRKIPKKQVWICFLMLLQRICDDVFHELFEARTKEHDCARENRPWSRPLRQVRERRMA